MLLHSQRRPFYVKSKCSLSVVVVAAALSSLFFPNKRLKCCKDGRCYSNLAAWKEDFVESRDSFSFFFFLQLILFCSSGENSQFQFWGRRRKTEKQRNSIDFGREPWKLPSLIYRGFLSCKYFLNFSGKSFCYSYDHKDRYSSILRAAAAFGRISSTWMLFTHAFKFGES